MRRFLSRLILVPLALFFLFEAWLWDRLSPVVGALVALIPLTKIKEWIRAAVAELSPGITLAIFVVPAILLFPLKLLGLWLLGHGQWILAAVTLVFAKLVGVGVTAFLFDATRPKLLQMNWFRIFYEAMLRLRAAASALIDPLKRKIRRMIRLLAPGRAGRTLRLIRRLRALKRQSLRVH